MPCQFTDTPDVTISIGSAPAALIATNTVHKVGVSINPTEYLLKFLNIANYYAANGNSIIIEPLAAADDRSIRLFLLSSVMATLLKQRNMMALNAPEVEYRDGVAFFL